MSKANGCCGDDGASCCQELTPDQKKKEEVQQYYGKEIKRTDDLKTNCCTTNVKFTKKQKEILSKIHPEVLSKFYGCGCPIPSCIEGITVLDLGSGTGRDVFLCSALVGQKGKVIGVDMTDEQLEIAKRHIPFHTSAFGFSSDNVEFRKGFIEDLRAAGIADNSIDLVISNCVVNLSPDKLKVLSEIYRVLKPGGELYFSDVYSDRRIPENLRQNKVLWGECLSGALYIEDFRRIMTKVGFNDFRAVESSFIKVGNKEIENLLGNIQFTSQTIRAFKLPLEDKCEDYGQTLTYKGTVEENPHAFVLDGDHLFVTEMSAAVCGNTADMISLTRFAKHFNVTSRKEHRGIFAACGGGSKSSSSSSSCCG
jgi:ubiquinone/menaquinone biosynthesis C-methylase UbiE